MRQNHFRIVLAFSVLLLIHAGGSGSGSAQEKRTTFEIPDCIILLSDERMPAVGQTGNIARILTPAEGLISQVYKQPGEQLLEFKGSKTLKIEGVLPMPGTT
jgi:hypothetical protein